MPSGETAPPDPPRMLRPEQVGSGPMLAGSDSTRKYVLREEGRGFCKEGGPARPWHHTQLPVPWGLNGCCRRRGSRTVSALYVCVWTPTFTRLLEAADM